MKRFSGGLSALANHTWSKLLDDIGWTNPFYRAFDYGRSRDDLGQSFKFSGIWEIPGSFKGAAGRVLNGWGLTVNTSWHGGFPFTLRSGRDNSLTGIGRDRPDFIGTDIHDAQLDSGRSHNEMVSKFFDPRCLSRMPWELSETRERTCCSDRATSTLIWE